jgi:hypothetical protein
MLNLIVAFLAIERAAAIKPEARGLVYWTNVSTNTKVPVEKLRSERRILTPTGQRDSGKSYRGTGPERRIVRANYISF